MLNELIEIKRQLAKLKAALHGDEFPQKRPPSRQIKTADGEEMEFVTGSIIPFKRHH